MVSDDRLGTIDCPHEALDPGAVMTCTAEETAEIGYFSSQGRISARAGAQTFTDSDPLYWHIRQEPRLHGMVLEVSVNGHDADDPTGPLVPVGGSVRFTYTATYTGNNLVYSAEIRDPRIPESMISCSGGGTMRPGNTMRCTATVQAEAGQYASSVTVVAWDNDGTRVSAGDPVHYYGMP